VEHEAVGCARILGYLARAVRAEAAVDEHGEKHDDRQGELELSVVGWT